MFNIPLNKKFDINLLNLEEMGKQLELIKNSEGDNLNSFKSVDWPVNKKGNRQKLYARTLNGNAKNEFSLTFRLKKLIEIKEIQIGMISFWVGHTDCHVEPISIIVEGGMQENLMTSICTLAKIDDVGYSNLGVSVFGKILDTSSSSFELKQTQNNISRYIENKQLFRVKYLKFTFHKSVNSFTEQSPLSSFAKKPRCYGINFISIMGFDVSYLGNYAAEILDMQKKSALKVLSRFTAGTFKNTIKQISNTSESIKEIKDSFNILMKLLTQKKPNYRREIYNILIPFGSNNYDFGIWLVTNIINQCQIKEQIGLISRIAITIPALCIHSIELLKEIIFSQVKDFNEKKIKVSFNKIYYFMLTYFKILDYSSLLQKDPYPILVNEENISNLIILMNKKKVSKRTSSNSRDKSEFQSNFPNAILKMIIYLLFPPGKYINKDLDPTSIYKKYILNDESLFKLNSLCVISSNLCAEEFISNGIEIKEYESKIQNKQIVKYQELLVWISLLCSKIIKNYMSKRKVGIKIFNCLCFWLENNTLSSLSKECLSAYFEIIKITVCGDPDSEKELSQLIFNCMEILNDNPSELFVNEILMNVLRMEVTIPVSLWGFDNENKVYFKKLRDEEMESKNYLYLKNSCLNEKEIFELKIIFEKMSILNGKTNIAHNYVWKKIYLSTIPGKDSFSNFISSIQGTSPNIFIISGFINGSPFKLGGYCSSAIPSIELNENSETVKIPYSSDNFMFLFIDGKYHYFTFDSNESFGTLNTYYDNN